MTKEPDALTELTETESARPWIGPRLSATVAWVDWRGVESLREALVKAGYAPKMVSDGDGREPCGKATLND